jgi:hypothetical protein
MAFGRDDVYVDDNDDVVPSVPAVERSTGGPL